MIHDKIDAFPRKKLFIDILTQDVSVSTCILDLIDNSVDSFVREKLQERKEIKLTIKEDYFEIFDNCGGIDKDFLKEHVFKFGSENREINNPTLGMYGIGLKRSIFKLGNEISLETDNGKHFSFMALNVPKWESNLTDWDIPFEYEDSKPENIQKNYTRIVVKDLHKEISTKFSLESFKNELLDTIKKFYCIIINDSIDFYCNDIIVIPNPLLVPVDSDYAPSVHIEEKDGVGIEIICFVEPTKGTKQIDAVNQRGWNLFCNKRLILANDTSDVTGWVGGGDKSMLPKYHGTYNEFRGIVFLQSNNPFDLPLNTSKSGLNIEHKLYHYVLNLMIKTARPIIEYLADKYKSELKAEEDINSQIEQVIDDNFKASYQPATTIRVASTFKAPKRVDIEAKMKWARIAYAKDKVLVGKVMKYMGAHTYKEIGEKTFDYYLNMEGLEDE